ncbi:MAG: tRNA lysidine(34) synthetase TilS [Candidatus Marinimicrobia bacterium]|nr:tRNA lysidine(34) synthetase TilS [Candidatus Neomarinimicrobiota bacterium]
MLAHKVHRYITTKKLLNRGEKILIALSGGRDSVALLYLLHELAPAWEWDLVAGHVNHGLRPGADNRESDLCRKITQELGIPLVEGKLTIPEKGNLEQIARELRYELLATWAKEKECTVIVTAHHLDDQAETILYRLLKGSGLRGLQGIHPAVQNLRRPLLGITRQEIDTYCLTRGILFAEDQSNQDESFTRNHIRYTLLPFLKGTGFPNVSFHLAKLSESATHMYHALEMYIQEDLNSLFTPHPVGFEMDLKTWRRLDENRQMLLLKEFFVRMDSHKSHVSWETLQQLAAFLRESEKGRSFEIDSNRKWIVETTSVIITSGIDTGKITLWQPGKTIQWTSWFRLTWETASVPKTWEVNPWEEYFADDLIHIKVYIRGWKPGDRIEPWGEGKHLVSDLLKDASVPAMIRPHYPVVVVNDDILWIPGIRRSKEYPVLPTSTSCVKLTGILKKEYYDKVKQKFNH